MSVTSSQSAQPRFGVMAGKVGRRMQAHPARVLVCNAFLVNAFGDGSRLGPSWPSNGREGIFRALPPYRIIPFVKTYTIRSLCNSYDHIDDVSRCSSIATLHRYCHPSQAGAPGRGRFSATANQTLRCTTSTPKMRCSRRADTHSGFACYSCSRFTTRSLYAMRAQTSRRGSPMCTVMQR